MVIKVKAVSKPGLTLVVKTHQLDWIDHREGGEVASLQDFLSAVVCRYFAEWMYNPFLDAAGARAGR